jgi:hypothetical protein
MGSAETGDWERVRTLTVRKRPKSLIDFVVTTTDAALWRKK